MRIIIIQGAFLPVPAIQGGAVEKIWYRMGQEFASMGHSVIHIGKSHDQLSNEEMSNGVKYIRIPGYDTPSSLVKLKFLDLLYSLRTLPFITRETDILITNTFWFPFLLRGKSAKRVFVDVQRVPKGQMKFYQHVGRLRACSPAIADAIRKELPVNSQHLISYIPNPVPFEVKPLQVKRQPVILFVGRLHPEKGVDILIQAYAMLRPEIRNVWKLVITGPHDFKDGGGGEIYFQKLLSSAAGLNIEFTGPVYDEENLIHQYAESSIFCYPAQETSGDAAPVAPREAMAYGCVPVVSELPCFNDFIINEKNGVTYNHRAENQAEELFGKLEMLINNPGQLENLSETGKSVITDYSPTRIAKEFINDFNEVICSNQKL